MLARYARNRDPRVIVGAGIGLDAAALDGQGRRTDQRAERATGSRWFFANRQCANKRPRDRLIRMTIV